MADCAKISIAKLNSQNYTTWSFKVELALVKEGLWDVISEDAPTQPDDAWSKRDQKARATIGLLVEDAQLTHIRKENTARNVWNALKQYHQKSTLTSKVFLLKKLCRKQLDEGGDMEAHLNYMTDTIDQLTEMGEQLADQLSVAMILSSVPESYGTLVTALEARPEADLTAALVKGKLIDEYKRRKESDFQGARNSETALKTGTHVTGKKNKHDYHKKGNSKGNKGCFFCHGNHFKRDCEKYAAWKAKQESPHSGGAGNKHKVARATEAEEDDEACFQVTFANKMGNDVQDWYIDSGASSHMAGNENFFSKLEEIPRKIIHLADGEIIYATGIGEGEILCDTGTGIPKKVKIKDVLYVPVLKGNLLSVSKLVERGMTVDFHDNVCDISHKGNILAQAEIRSSLYRIRLCEKVFQVQEKKCSLSCIHGWHNKLGHRDPTAIRQVVDKGLANGIQIKDCGLKIQCDTCVRGKLTRLPFPRHARTQSTQLLDLVHTDIAGPMQTQTPGGKKYVLTIIDDYSRYTEVYLLAKKSETLGKVKEYVNMVKNKFGRAPKKIRSDRGGEYTGTEFKEYLAREGIKQELTAPYTPEQNGVAERKFRYLFQMVRCLLIESGLNKQYWGEAIHTANHIQNRLPTRGSEEIPYKRWHKRDPNFEYFQTFGVTAYAHKPKEQRQKLDEKAEKLVFVGYQEGSKAYRLLNTDTNRITISRDVRFFTGNSEVKEQVKPNMESEDSLNESCTVPLASQEEEEREEVINLPTIELRRSTRINKGNPPKRLIETINVSTEEEIVEPKSRREALAGPQSKQWEEAMDQEMQALKDNGTWKLTAPQSGKNIIGSKWIFKTKRDETGHVVRYKARLVAQGYAQKYGHDYDEVFAPVVNQTTLRLLLTIAGKRNMHVKHFDVETAFLHGELQHEIYMHQPEGKEEPGKENLVCRLEKNLYGLKQGAMEWFNKLHDVLINFRFSQSQADPCLYSRRNDKDWTYIVVHVDDIVGASVNEEDLDKFESELKQEFVIKCLGNLKQCLGVHYTRDEGIFSVDQQEYIKGKLKEYKLQDVKPSIFPMDPNYHCGNGNGEELLESNIIYRSAIGSLMYLSVNSRPDIAAATSILSRKVSAPTQRDWGEVKRVFRYLKGTSHYRLRLGDNSSSEDPKLIGYADADWGGDPASRKSNSGQLFQLFGGTICWASKQQKLVALSSTEAELISLTEACKEVIWINKLLADFKEEVLTPPVLYEDNQSCIKLLTGRRVSQRTKHVDTKYNFVCDMVKEKKVLVTYCPTTEMLADMLTKPLNSVKIEHFSKLIGLY